MARTTITIEDTEDGKMKLTLESDPPLRRPFSQSQLYAMAAHHFLQESGAPFIAPMPALLLDEYKLAPVAPLA